MIRRSASRYSVGRAAHWLILLGADRVASIEAHLASFATGRPDNPVTETGIRSELSHHGWSSRRGRKRVDGNHSRFDPLLVGGPRVITGAAAGVAVGWARRVRRSCSSANSPVTRRIVPTNRLSVRPAAVVCLGATAAQALLGTNFRLTRHRGERFDLGADGDLGPDHSESVVATVHPSSILRGPTDQRERAFDAFVADLRVVRDLAAST